MSRTENFPVDLSLNPSGSQSLHSENRNEKDDNNKKYFKLNEIMSKRYAIENRKQKRREGNRLAARRCREKKKVKESNTNKTLEELTELNKKLKAEITTLEKEKEILRAKLIERTCFPTIINSGLFNSNPIIERANMHSRIQAE